MQSQLVTKVAFISEQRKYCDQVFSRVYFVILGGGVRQSMGKTNVCPRAEGYPHFDCPIFCELKTAFRLKIGFKMVIESFQIAHSIKNFILKNVITRHILIK